MPLILELLFRWLSTIWVSSPLIDFSLFSCLWSDGIASYLWHFCFRCSFLDAKEGRYNPKMSPKIPMNKWRKGSQVLLKFLAFKPLTFLGNFMFYVLTWSLWAFQWIALIRRHAEVIVDDEVVFPLFQKFCVVRIKQFVLLSVICIPYF